MYRAANRPIEDWRSMPMPMGIFNFGTFLWKRLRHFLGNISVPIQPNCFQLIFYFEQVYFECVYAHFYQPLVGLDFLGLHTNDVILYYYVI